MDIKACRIALCFYSSLREYLMFRDPERDNYRNDPEPESETSEAISDDGATDQATRDARTARITSERSDG